MAPQGNQQPRPEPTQMAEVVTQLQKVPNHHHDHHHGPRILRWKKDLSDHNVNGEYTFEELEAREQRRRAIHRRVERSFYNILLHMDGTVLSFLLSDTLFWITCIIYVALRAVCRYGSVPGFVAELGGGNVGIIGGFISFFLVLYVNKSHARYFGLYNTSMAIKARILETASLAKVYMDPTKARRLIRYLNAAHVAGYVGLSSKTYSSDVFFAKLNQDFGLLTDEEHQRMQEIGLEDGGAACSRELLLECQEIVFSTIDTIDAATSNIFRGNILQIQSNIEKLFDDEDLPIPFFHVHFICLLAVLYLPLFAISTAITAGTGQDVFWTADIVGGLVVMLQAIFIIGLRVLGQKMSNPYGDDLIDLSVMHFVTYTWTMSKRILVTNKMATPSETTERELADREVSIGRAWEHNQHLGTAKNNTAEDIV